MEVSQLKQMKDMKRELNQYKKIVAEQTLKITVLKDVIEKKAQGAAESETLLDMPETCPNEPSAGLYPF